MSVATKKNSVWLQQTSDKEETKKLMDKYYLMTAVEYVVGFDVVRFGKTN